MLYGITTITIVNAIGKIMYEETFDNKFNTLKIDLEGYAKGFYLLNLKNNQKNETLRFIKK
jgi:UTP-glucose-1-phosphate uridylyltransferase